MSQNHRTVISVTDARQSALYFDHVVPLNLALLVDNDIGITPRDTKRLVAYLNTLPRDLFPRHLMAQPDFWDEFVIASGLWMALVVMAASDELDDALDDVGPSIVSFMRKYRLDGLPWDLSSVALDALEGVPRSGTPSTDALVPVDDVMVKISSLNLVDTASVSWEHIAEFRTDPEARRHLRRLRLFAYNDLVGKSRAEVEDLLAERLDGYNEAVKKWGFETKLGAISSILNSKVTHGAAGSSFVAALMHEPIASVVAASAGAAIVAGSAVIEVLKRRLVRDEITKSSPVSYISFARARLDK